MKINISSKNYVVADRLKAIIEKKLSRMEKYFGDEAVCSVVCRKEGKVEKMEVLITSKGQSYRGEVHTGNMYTNIDIILPKIERQLIKHKDRLRTLLKKEAYEDKKLAYHVFTPKIEASEIVKRKSFEIQPISHAEAEMLLDTSAHDFYIYTNAANGKTCIIYKRKVGDLGVIEISNSISSSNIVSASGKEVSKEKKGAPTPKSKGKGKTRREI